MHKLFFVLISLILNNAWAKDCLYSIDSNSTKVSWSAYKTPIKAAVGGSFTKITLSNTSSNKDAKQSFVKTKFVIDTTSTSTNDKMRDANIVNSFFKLMKGGTNITGEVLNIDGDVITIQLTMNKVTKKVPLKYTLVDDQLTGTGHIDVLDFAMSKSLKGINKTCYDLHEGKTWSDVAIKLEAKLLKKCE